MLNREKVMAALAAKRERFVRYGAEQQSQETQIEHALRAFLALSSDAMLARLGELAIEWPGALPTAELDQATWLRLPFGTRWRSHEDARAWAREVLAGHPVAAVDGSQILPTKDISLPVGMIQVGWFVNFHDGHYRKEVEVEVLAPDELSDELDEVEGGFPDWRVNQVRFVAECRRLCQLMASFADAPLHERPLCFFDGSLIISFAGQLRPSRAAPYLAAVRELLDASQRYQVPLAGFVDSSFSRDTVQLLNLLTGPPYISLSDGALLDPLLPAWGDRSPFFLCARADQLSTQGHADFYRQVAFCYVRTVGERPPARVELPVWLLESGRGNEILDLVRAECVVGAGYPYAIETADAVAVLQHSDRERFLALLQQFAGREGLPFTVARKAQSKQARRT